MENKQGFDLAQSIQKAYNNPRKSDTVSDIRENQDFLSDLLLAKKDQEKIKTITQKVDYDFVTALELVLQQYNSTGSPIDGNKCEICSKKFFTNLAKLNLSDITEDLMNAKENEIIRLNKCMAHTFHANCILNCIKSNTPPLNLYCAKCIKAAFPDLKIEEKKVDEKPNNRLNGKPKEEDAAPGEPFEFPGATYKIALNEKSDPLLVQIVTMKSYLQESIRKKQTLKKDPKITKVANYHFVTALEIFIRHKDPKHNSLDDEKCSICMCEFFDDTKKLTINDIMDDMVIPKEDEIIQLEKCDGHYFHTSCIINFLSSQKSSSIKCPNCMRIYGILTGDQPPGTMAVNVNSNLRCSGYNNCGTIIINYSFPSGTLPDGRRYHGTNRVAYLPDNQEGREVLQLLRTSFDRRLTFTIGTSVTTGAKDSVIWNGVHHKTNVSGGSTSFGYPDPTYFNRVKQELASRGVTLD